MQGVSQRIWQGVASVLRENLEFEQKCAKWEGEHSKQELLAKSASLEQDFSTEESKDRSVHSLASDAPGFVLLDEKKTIQKVVSVFNRYDLGVEEMRESLRSVRMRLSEVSLPLDVQQYLSGVFEPLITVCSRTKSLGSQTKAFVMDRRKVPFIDARERHDWAESSELGRGVWDLSRNFSEEAQEFLYHFLREESFFKDKKNAQNAVNQNSISHNSFSQDSIDQDSVNKDSIEHTSVETYLELAHFAEMSLVPSLSKMIDSELGKRLGSYVQCYKHLRDFYLYLIDTSSTEILGSTFAKCENILLAFYIHGAAQPDEEVLSHVKVISRKLLPNFHSTKLLALIPHCRALEKLEVNYLYQEHIDLLAQHCPELRQIVSYKSSFRNMPIELSRQLTLLSLDNNKQVTHISLPGPCKVHLDKCYRLEQLVAEQSQELHLSQCYNLHSLQCRAVESLYLDGCVLLETIDAPLVKRQWIKGCESLKSGLPATS